MDFEGLRQHVKVARELFDVAADAVHALSEVVDDVIQEVEHTLNKLDPKEPVDKEPSREAKIAYITTSAWARFTNYSYHSHVDALGDEVIDRLYQQVKAYAERTGGRL